MSTRLYPLFANHPSPFPTDGRYRAICSHVVDGDTFDTLVDLAFGVSSYETLRLHDFDAPEIFHPKSPAERDLGNKAFARCRELLENRAVLLRTFKDDQTFGRYVADVWFWTGTEWKDLAQTLRAEKLSKADVVA